MPSEEKKEPRPVLATSVWDEYRCKEYELLCRLLNEVTLIDRGSNCLERIASCITLAEQLRDTDWNSGDSVRPSFVSFLQDRILVDRFGPDYKDQR